MMLKMASETRNLPILTAFQTFIEDILIALDNKRFAMGIFLALTKAFDVINHNLLLSKLELYGIKGKIHEWMSSYLKDRTQFVEIQYVDQSTSNLKDLYFITQGN
jgi:hypothetical protein